MLLALLLLRELVVLEADRRCDDGGQGPGRAARLGGGGHVAGPAGLLGLVLLLMLLHLDGGGDAMERRGGRGPLLELLLLLELELGLLQVQGGWGCDSCEGPIHGDDVHGLWGRAGHLHHRLQHHEAACVLRGDDLLLLLLLGLGLGLQVLHDCGRWLHGQCVLAREDLGPVAREVEALVHDQLLVVAERREARDATVVRLWSQVVSLRALQVTEESGRRNRHGSGGGGSSGGGGGGGGGDCGGSLRAGCCGCNCGRISRQLDLGMELAVVTMVSLEGGRRGVLGLRRRDRARARGVRGRNGRLGAAGDDRGAGTGSGGDHSGYNH